METDDLFSNEGEAWSIFGGFQWNVLNYGRLQSNVRLQDALFQQLLVDFNTVITNLNALATQQDVLASSRGDVANNLVQLYRALGGGWQVRDNRDPVDLLPAEMKETMKQRTDAWEDVLQ